MQKQKKMAKMVRKIYNLKNGSEILKVEKRKL